MALSDEEAVRRVLAGDTAAFEVIIRRYNQRLFRAARGILRDETEAEDVVQEAYLQSLRHLRAFRWQSSLATWLTRIAVNEACARRRNRTRPAMPTVTPQRDDGADIGIRRREAAAALREHIDALPSSLRVVLVLRVVEGLGTTECAESLGLSEAAVKVRLHRAREALQRRMAADLVDELQSVYAFDGERCDRIVRGVMGRARAALSNEENAEEDRGFRAEEDRGEERA
jgi:RNA polymerase sigma-70 factor (ECF subfamily)